MHKEYFTKIQEYFKSAPDASTAVWNNTNYSLLIIYDEKLTDVSNFFNFHFERFKKANPYKLHEEFPGLVKKIENTEIKTICNHIYSGNLVIIIDESNGYYLSSESKPKRSLEVSQIDPTNLFTSQEGFIEDIRINMALVRKRIKRDDMIVKELKIGTNNKNTIFIVYLKDNEEKAKEIENKIIKENLTCAFSINTIGKIFQKKHLIPTVIYTGSPDNFCNAILDNRICVMLDNSPTQLILPAPLSYFSSMKNEIDAPIYFNVISKTFLLLFFIITMFFLGLFVAIFNYNLNSLTITAISNVKISERGTTLSLFLEIVLVLIFFEFFRYVSSRSSTNYVQNIIIIIGGLLIGQNLMNAGIIGSFTLLITALCYLAAFAYTNNVYLITSISLFRLLIVIASYFGGLVGFFIASTITIVYFISLKTFHTPYLYPFAPTYINKIKHFFAPREKRKDENHEN